MNHQTNKKLKVLVACEESQAVTIAFRERGHEAYSCDLLDCSGGHPEWHIKQDAIEVLGGGAFTLGNDFGIDEAIVHKWDLVIAHPPCTRLTNSGVRWLTSKKPRAGYKWNENMKRFINEDEIIWGDLVKGIGFFRQFVLYGKAGNKIGIENPVPHMYAREGFLYPNTNNLFIAGIGAPTQIIQPYEYGHLEKKATGLWLYGLPEVRPTNNVYEDMMKLPYGERAKVHHASPGPERARIRSKTYAGIAEALAKQWG